MSARAVPTLRPGRATLAPSSGLAWLQRFTLPRLYLLVGLLWLATRVLMVIHQGSWPWMNFFVVETAQEMLAGDWNEAVRPLLPSLLVLPLLLAGVDDLQAIIALYFVASLVQYGAYVLFLRELFPTRRLEQALALALFLVVPLNHSIHHWRNTPVILASSGTLLIAAHWLRLHRRDLAGAWSRGSVAWAFGAMALGVWSRTEVVTFTAVLVGLVAWRAGRRLLPLAALYAVAAALTLAASLSFARLAGADLVTQSSYQVHTFLDSTPTSWLSPGCRDFPSENCREADGWTYFGPEDPSLSLPDLLRRQPWTAVAKTWRSGLDNLWEMLGRNISTYPGIAWFVLLVLLIRPRVRRDLGRVPAPAWAVAGAALGVTVLPPLAWAPPHPQYHLHSLMGVVVVAVPVLASLLRRARGTSPWVAAFFAGNVLLSAFRYTRYPGY